MGKRKNLSRLTLVPLLLAGAAGCNRGDTDRLANIGRILADRTGKVVEKVRDDFAQPAGKTAPAAGQQIEPQRTEEQKED